MVGGFETRSDLVSAAEVAKIFRVQRISGGEARVCLDLFRCRKQMLKASPWEMAPWMRPLGWKPSVWRAREGEETSF